MCWSTNGPKPLRLLTPFWRFLRVLADNSEKFSASFLRVQHRLSRFAFCVCVVFPAQLEQECQESNVCVRVAGVQLCGLLKLIHGIAALSSVPENRSQLSVTESVVWIEAFCFPQFCEALAE